MPVHQLSVGVWSDTGCVTEDFVDPPWSLVESSVRALDGHPRNDVYLQLVADDPATWLAVGGGSAGYVVTGSIADRRFPMLVRRGVDDEPTVALVVGGQEGAWPAHQVVTLDQALAATRRVFDAGSFDCGVDWQYV